MRQIRYFEWIRLENTFPSIASMYDRMNHLMSLGNDVQIRGEAITHIPKHTAILDAGAGPGKMSEIALKLVDPKQITMLDPNLSFMKDEHKDLRINKVLATFETLPFKDLSFDAVMCGFSFRDAIDHKKAAFELARVLKKNGTLVIVDLGKPDNLILKSGFYAYITIIPVLFAMFVDFKKIRDYTTLLLTYRTYPTYSEILKLFEMQGLKLLKFKKKMFGGLIYMVWKKR